MFNVDSLAMIGKMPIAINHINILTSDYKQAQTKGKIIAIFHTLAGEAVLTDAAYDTLNKVKTGNPYKPYVEDLMKQGVQVELCGVTAEGHGWGNSDLLPGVKVNTDAMSRLTKLTQDGYVQITE